MFIVTICPKCDKDFMYHKTDYHLWKAVAWLDKDLKVPCSFEVICQDCHQSQQEETQQKKTQQGD